MRVNGIRQLIGVAAMVVALSVVSACGGGGGSSGGDDPSGGSAETAVTASRVTGAAWLGGPTEAATVEVVGSDGETLKRVEDATDASGSFDIALDGEREVTEVRVTKGAASYARRLVPAYRDAGAGTQSVVVSPVTATRDAVIEAEGPSEAAASLRGLGIDDPALSETMLGQHARALAAFKREVAGASGDIAPNDLQSRTTLARSQASPRQVLANAGEHLPSVRVDCFYDETATFPKPVTCLADSTRSGSTFTWELGGGTSVTGRTLRREFEAGQEIVLREHDGQGRVLFQTTKQIVGVGEITAEDSVSLGAGTSTASATRTSEAGGSNEAITLRAGDAELSVPAGAIEGGSELTLQRADGTILAEGSQDGQVIHLDTDGDLVPGATDEPIELRLPLNERQRARAARGQLVVVKQGDDGQRRIDGRLSDDGSTYIVPLKSFSWVDLSVYEAPQSAQDFLDCVVEQWKRCGDGQIVDFLAASVPDNAEDGDKSVTASDVRQFFAQGGYADNRAVVEALLDSKVAGEPAHQVLYGLYRYWQQANIEASGTFTKARNNLGDRGFVSSVNNYVQKLKSASNNTDQPLSGIFATQLVGDDFAGQAYKTIEQQLGPVLTRLEERLAPKSTFNGRVSLKSGSALEKVGRYLTVAAALTDVATVFAIDDGDSELSADEAERAVNALTSAGVTNPLVEYTYGSVAKDAIDAIEQIRQWRTQFKRRQLASCTSTFTYRDGEYKLVQGVQLDQIRVQAIVAEIKNGCGALATQVDVKKQVKILLQKEADRLQQEQAKARLAIYEDLAGVLVSALVAGSENAELDKGSGVFSRRIASSGNWNYSEPLVRLTRVDEGAFADYGGTVSASLEFEDGTQLAQTELTLDSGASNSSNSAVVINAGEIVGAAGDVGFGEPLSLVAKVTYNIKDPSGNSVTSGATTEKKKLNGQIIPPRNELLPGSPSASKAGERINPRSTLRVRDTEQGAPVEARMIFDTSKLANSLAEIENAFNRGDASVRLVIDKITAVSRNDGEQLFSADLAAASASQGVTVDSDNGSLIIDDWLSDGLAQQRVVTLPASASDYALGGYTPANAFDWVVEGEIVGFWRPSEDDGRLQFDRQSFRSKNRQTLVANETPQVGRVYALDVRPEVDYGSQTLTSVNLTREIPVADEPITGRLGLSGPKTDGFRALSGNVELAKNQDSVTVDFEDVDLSGAPGQYLVGFAPDARTGQSSSARFTLTDGDLDFSPADDIVGRYFVEQNDDAQRPLFKLGLILDTNVSDRVGDEDRVIVGWPDGIKAVGEQYTTYSRSTDAAPGWLEEHRSERGIEFQSGDLRRRSDRVGYNDPSERALNAAFGERDIAVAVINDSGRVERRTVLKNLDFPPFGQRRGVAASSSDDAFPRLADYEADSDADGLPDQWEQRYFGGPEAADPDADPNGDGLTNRETFYGEVESVPDAESVSGSDVRPERNPTKAPPAVEARSWRIEAGEQLNGEVAAQGEALTFSVISEPAQGTLDLDGNTGSFTYDAQGVSSGSYEFVVEVTDGRNPSRATQSLVVNGPPSASALGQNAVPGESITADLQATDPDGDEVTFSLVAQPSQGSATLASGGALEYTAPSGFVGTVEFDYRVSDGNGGSDTATVTIEIIDPQIDVLAELARPRIRPGDTAKLQIEARDAAAPYTVSIDWDGSGAGAGVTQTTDFAVYEHTYSSAGSYQPTVEVTDAKGRTYTETLSLEVATQAADSTQWQAQAHNLDTVEGPYSVDLKVNQRSYDGQSVDTYTTGAGLPAGDDVFVEHRLPLPVGEIDLTNGRKARITAVMQAGDRAYYDRELHVKTPKRKFQANFVDPTAKTEIEQRTGERLALFRVTDLVKESQRTITRDDNAQIDNFYREAHPNDANKALSVAMEFDGSSVSVQSFDSANGYQELYRYNGTSLGSAMAEIGLTYLGEGTTVLALLEYDQNGDGTYDSEESLVLTTANKRVDWSSFTGDSGSGGFDGGMAALNDTGITWCADGSNNNLDCPIDGFPNQDAQFGRDAKARAGNLSKQGSGAAGFDFTKLDANGDPLPASASDWSCVRDNHTGLIWEVKTTDGGLRDKSNEYTWYNPDDTANGGNAGTQNGGSCSGSDCDTHAYVQAVNAQGLCGASDWRIPTRNELQSIVHHGHTDPAIDTDFFPNTPGRSWFWSASPYAGDSDDAWGVNFFDGSADRVTKGTFFRVRLVRVGQ